MAAQVVDSLPAADPSINGQSFIVRDNPSVIHTCLCNAGGCAFCEAPNPTNCEDNVPEAILPEQACDPQWRAANGIVLEQSEIDEACACHQEYKELGIDSGELCNGNTSNCEPFGEAKIAVELRLGFSNLFKTKACDNPCENFYQLNFEACYKKFPDDEAARSACLKAEIQKAKSDKWKNLVLVIDAKQNEVPNNNQVIPKSPCKDENGAPISIPGTNNLPKENEATKPYPSTFKFPIKIPLTTIADYLDKNNLTDPCTIANHFDGNNEAKRIKILDITFPTGNRCVPRISGDKGYLNAVQRDCSPNKIGVANLPGQVGPQGPTTLEDLASCAGAADGDANWKSPSACKACQAAIDRMKTSKCFYLFQPEPVGLRPDGVPDDLLSKLQYHVVCPNVKFQKLCKLLSCISSADGNPSAEPNNTVVLDIDARIEDNSTSTTVGSSDCMNLFDTTINMTRDGDNFTFTITIGDTECKDAEADQNDSPYYTKNKPTYAVARKKYKIQNDNCDDEEPCQCAIATIQDGKFYIQDRTENQELLGQNGTVWPAPSVPQTNGEWIDPDNEYKYVYFKCKTCEDPVTKKAIEDFCKKNDQGWCCVDGDTDGYKKNLSFSYRTTCCAQINNAGGKGSFYADLNNLENKDTAKRRCIPTELCCIPGPKDGGLCIFKTSPKTDLSFNIELDLDTCFLNPTKNACKQTGQTRLGVCERYKTQTVGCFSITKPDGTVISNLDDGLENSANSIFFNEATGKFNWGMLFNGGSYNGTYIPPISNILIPSDPPSYLVDRLQKYRICSESAVANNYSFCRSMDLDAEKEELKQRIQDFYGQGNNGFKRITTQSQCAKLANTYKWTYCDGKNYRWTKLGTGDGTPNDFTYVSDSCDKFLEGPTKKTISMKVVMQDFCWVDAYGDLNETNLKDIIKNTFARFSPIQYENFRNNFNRQIKNLINFVPGSCDGDNFVCMTKECCEQYITNKLSALNKSEAEITSAIGSMKFSPGQGQFLCGNIPNEPELMDLDNPPYAVPSFDDNTPGLNYKAISDFFLTTEAINSNRLRLTNIKIESEDCNKISTRPLRTFYISPTGDPNNSDDEKNICKFIAKDLNKCCLAGEEPQEGKDYVFVRGYTKTSQLQKVDTDLNGNIVVEIPQTGNGSPAEPGSCATYTETEDKDFLPDPNGRIKRYKYYTPKYWCDKVNGHIVDKCDDPKCADLSNETLPTPDPQPPIPAPNDPDDPNDPDSGSNPPPQPKSDCAKIEYKYRSDTDGTMQTGSFILKLPVIINGEKISTISALDKISFSRIGAGEIASKDPNKRPDFKKAAVESCSVTASACADVPGTGGNPSDPTNPGGPGAPGNNPPNPPPTVKCAEERQKLEDASNAFNTHLTTKRSNNMDLSEKLQAYDRAHLTFVNGNCKGFATALIQVPWPPSCIDLLGTMRDNFPGTVKTLGATYGRNPESFLTNWVPANEKFGTDPALTGLFLQLKNLEEQRDKARETFNKCMQNRK